MQRSSASSASGCLEAFAYLWLVGLSLFVVGAVAVSNTEAAVAVAVFIIGAWVGVAIWIKKRRAAKAAALAAAQAAEYQRQMAAQQAFQAAQHAEHQRQLAAQQAYQAAWQVELQRQRAEKQAEDERRLAAQQAELELQRKERWERLVGTYGEEDAEKIWRGRPWLGCTETMLRETLGPPADVDEKVLKTKTKYTYKYRPRGGNRYGLRVFLDDDQVTGWEDKD